MNDKAFQQSAKIFADSARNMEIIVMRMENTVQQQNDTFGRLADTLDKIAERISRQAQTSTGESSNKQGAFLESISSRIDKLSVKNAAGKFEGSAAAAAVGGSAASLVNALKDYAKRVPVKAEERLINFLKSFNAAIDKDKAEAYTAFSKAMESTGQWVGKLGKGLLVWILVPKDAGKKVAGVITEVSKAFADADIKKLESGGQALTNIAKGVLMFGLSLVASAVLYAVGAVASLVIIPVISGFAYMFGKIGEAKIDAGVKTVAWMGLAILGFSAAIFAAGALAGGFDKYAEGAAIAALGMLVFSGLFYMLGDDKFSKRVETGAKALAWAGIGMASVALGIASFKLLGVDLASVMIAGLGVLLVGTAFGIIGMFDNIAKGAESIILSGIAMASVALGVWSFQALKITPGDILVSTMAIGLTGLVLGLAGGFAPEIALGVLVMGFSSLALWAVAAGVKQFKDITTDLALAAAGTITAVSTAMVLAGLGAVFILPGALAIGAAGLALAGIAHGLKEFKKISFTEADSDSIKSVIGSLASAFSAAGGTDGADKLFGITIGPNSVKRGISSVMDAGDALTSITKGLLEFQKLKLGTGSKIWGDVAVVITGIGETFSKLAPGNHTRGGLLGLIGLETNDVEQGISSVMNTGNALKSVTKGLQEFQKLKLGPGESKKLWDNIAYVVAGVGAAFASIGGDAKPMNGLFGWIGLETTSTEKGIDAVKGVGSTLVDLAKGVAAFAKGEFIDPITKSKVVFDADTIEKATKSITSVLTAVSGAFGDIVGSKSVDRGGLWGFISGAKDNPVAMGIDAVRGIGKELIDIASGVVGFATLKFGDVQIKETDIPLAGQRISDVLSVVATAFGDIGKQSSDKGGLWGWISGGKDNKVAMGLDAVKGMGSIVKELAESVQMFADLKDITGAENNLTWAATTMPTLLASLAKFPDGAERGVNIIQRIAQSANPITQLANSFDKLANGMEKFANSMKKMNGDTVKTTDMLIQSLVTFSKIDPNALGSLSDKGRALLQFVIERGGDQKSAPTPTQTTAPEPAPKTIDPDYLKPQPKPQPVQQPVQDNSAILSLQNDLKNMQSVLVRIEAALHDELKVKLTNT